MTKHFLHQTEKLKKKILHLTALVEESLKDAVKAVADLDTELATKVIDADERIDEYEVEIEEECLKVLALYQPVAGDLRFIVAVLKINNDLERIGDLVSNIAHRTASLKKHQGVKVPFDMQGMQMKTMQMVKWSADALVSSDTALAKKVCVADEEVDRIHQDAFKQLAKEIRFNPDLADYYISLLSISRNFERIADHATNIAEDVIYMVQGEIVRHGGK